MRQAAGVFRNAAILGQMRNRFHVRERRPAQREPFGLEDARTGLAQRLKREILQHVGLLKCETLRNQKVCPFPRLPLEPFLTPPVQQDRRTRTVSTVYSAASAIGTTDTKVRPLAFARNST